MRAVIVGAGIGGLAAAVALRRVGVESTIVEKVATLREVGAGLSIWSNALNALRELGLDTAVKSAGSIVERTNCQTPAGRFIVRNEFSALTQDSPPCICIHRAALHGILLEALPRDSVRTGTHCTGVKDSTAILASGERLEADLLIGADGIGSLTRGSLHGMETPRYAGYTCWRGICRDTGLLPDREALLVMGSGSQFGLWPCGSGQLYWFLTKNAPQGRLHLKADALEACRDWTPLIRNVIESTPADAILNNDILDRPPSRQWGRGNVTLLGDAAHPTTPNLGQGACQALEDAVVLAHCLTRAQRVDVALRAYESLRIPRTTAIVRDSWQGGKMLQLDNRMLESLRNWFIGSAPGRRMGESMLRSALTHPLPKLQGAL